MSGSSLRNSPRATGWLAVWLWLLSVLTAAAFPEIGIRQTGGSEVVDAGTTILGNVPVGTSVTRSYTIRNTGQSTLVISSVGWTGAGKADYSGTLSAPLTVVPGATASFSVTFAPAKAGASVAALRMETNDWDEGTFDMNFTGIGAVPEVAVTQGGTGNLVSGVSTVNFGSIRPGRQVTRSFTIRNEGKAPLAGLSLTKFGGTDFTMGALPAATLAGESSMVFSVTWTPFGAGTSQASLRLASNDTDENPFIINLTGTAVQPWLELELPGGEVIQDDFGTVSFGDVLIQTPVTRSLVVRNASAVPLTGIALSIDGPQASMFTVITPPAAALDPGATSTVVVSFLSSATGEAAAMLHVTADGAEVPAVDVNLSAVATPGGDTDDPDGDSVPNLIEYATGSDPLVRSGLPGVLSGTPGAFTFAFKRRVAALNELTLSVEWAADPAGEWTVLEPAALTLVSDDGTLQELVALLPPPPGERQYVRLRATRN